MEHTTCLCEVLCYRVGVFTRIGCGFFIFTTGMRLNFKLYFQFHQLLRITISLAVLCHLTGISIVLDVVTMTLCFFLMGWIFARNITVIWISALFLLYHSPEWLDKLIVKVRIFDIIMHVYMSLLVMCSKDYLCIAN